MLEIPESKTIAEQLNQAAAGKIVTEVIAAQSPHGFAWYNGEPSEYPGLLTGNRIDTAKANGGQVEFFLEEMRLSLNDGVNLRYLSADKPLPKKHQLYLGLDDGSKLVCTVQMYGGLMAYPAGAYDNYYYLVAKEKPNPLTGAFDEAYFMALCREAGPKSSAKELLATQQRIPGLGNGCSQDILFRARVHPQSKLSALSDGEVEALYKSVKETLAAMAEGGGRDTEKDLYGLPGGYNTVLSSKTKDTPCPVCGDIILRKAYLGGNVYFCPTCQPVKK